jgi:hypothetical protein
MLSSSLQFLCFRLDDHQSSNFDKIEKQKRPGLRLEARARAAAAAAGLIDAQELLVAHHPPAVTGDPPQEDLAKSG